MNSFAIPTLPAPITAILRDIVAGQSVVPASPGAMVDGMPALCLAACAAEAGFLARGDQDAATALRERAAISHGRQVLHEAFTELGWSTADCDAMLKFNDRQSPNLRKQRILEALEGN